MSKKIRKKNIKYYLFLWILNTSRFFLKKFRNIVFWEKRGNKWVLKNNSHKKKKNEYY